MLPNAHNFRRIQIRPIMKTINKNTKDSENSQRQRWKADDSNPLSHPTTTTTRGWKIGRRVSSFFAIPSCVRVHPLLSVTFTPVVNVYYGHTADHTEYGSARYVRLAGKWWWREPENNRRTRTIAKSSKNSVCLSFFWEYVNICRVDRLCGIYRLNWFREMFLVGQ